MVGIPGVVGGPLSATGMVWHYGGGEGHQHGTGEGLHHTRLYNFVKLPLHVLLGCFILLQ